MDYNELMILAKKKNILQKDICSKLGLTSAGFKRSVENKTISMKNMLELCQMLDITPNMLMGFGEKNDSFALSVEKDKRIALMEKYIKQLEDENARLKAQLGIDVPKKVG